MFTYRENPEYVNPLAFMRSYSGPRLLEAGKHFYDKPVKPEQGLSQDLQGAKEPLENQRARPPYISATEQKPLSLQGRVPPARPLRGRLRPPV